MNEKEVDLGFLRGGYLFAGLNSHDPSTQTGAVFVSRPYEKDSKILIESANIFPPGTECDLSLFEPSEKYLRIMHAEQVGVFSAARRGIQLEGSTIYSYWYPCATCAGHIIGAGITSLVVHKDLNDYWFDLCAGAGSEGKDWSASQKVAMDMFKRKGVDVRSVEGKLGVSILFRKKLMEF